MYRVVEVITSEKWLSLKPTNIKGWLAIIHTNHIKTLWAIKKFSSTRYLRQKYEMARVCWFYKSI